MWTNLKRLGLAATLLASRAAGEVLSTSGRWIVDSSGARVKLRCANWAGHMETKIPEGLNHQATSYIASWLSDNGFNCVRLTYSIDMALNPSQSVSDAFTAAGDSAGIAAADMTALYDAAVAANSWLADATTQSTFAHIIDDLAAANVLVVLDNHVSHASWCCGSDDGNGWWDEAAGYNDAASRYFNTANWLQGLAAMAEFAAAHPNVVGMSLRNELRAGSGQDSSDHADWYKFVGQGLDAIHGANADLLLVVGGPSYATDLSFLYGNPLDRAAFPDKVVWEFHNYQWSWSYSDCADHQAKLGSKTGYLLAEGKDYTGPLWLSEFGWNLDTPSANEVAYYTCLVDYMTGNDADWAFWALQGTYYIRDGQTDFEETFGLVDKEWSGWRNASFPDILGDMFDVTQGP
ncbi:cellulase family protein [Diplodia corticola]|uniref:Cellulase family protein n=1 Tax=Diplodia corticola TaxID=236234 RepID=A0A1J9RI30_9PEZI|nr:cellulase family protein [Diplodia corticola]OJD32211.1 cellulase family protein [Diplodia corticola]